ncbi:MAG: hypothetical protein AAGF73_07095 [Actinomycetota bacterium]
MHRLAELLSHAVAGRYPDADGAVEFVEPDDAGTCAAVEFNGHAVVLSHRNSGRLLEFGADGFGGASRPDVIRGIAGDEYAIGTHDVFLLSFGTGRPTLSERTDLEWHPRVQRSQRHRRDVHVFGDDTGLVTLGTGLVGRLELSIERFEGAPAGTGQHLIAAGLGAAAAGQAVWAQVAPGNAASLRTFLRAGFQPIGAETLLTPHA